MARGRRIAASALLVTGSVALLIGVLALYADRALLEPRGFADRAAAVFASESGRAAVAELVTDRVIEVAPDTIAGRPVIQAVVEGIVGTPPFRSLFRSAAFDVHRALLDRSATTITLTVADVGVLLIDALKSVSPELARRVPPGLQTELLELSNARESTVVAEIGRAAGDVQRFEWLALLIAVAALAGHVATARRHRLALRRIGIALAAVGLLIVALSILAVSLAGVGIEDERGAAALRAVAASFLAELRVWGLILAGCGAIGGAAASALIRPIDLSDSLERVSALVTATPSHPWTRAGRALGLIALGLVIILAHRLVIEITPILVGLAVLYVGVAELMRLGLASRGAAPELREARDHPQRPSRRRALTVAAAALASIAVFATVGLAVLAPEPPPKVVRACNGHPELCDRPLDQIAIAASHNAMSAASDPGWLFAAHERGIGDQLEAGVRALLIDTHYGFETPRGVATDLDLDTKSRAKIADELGDQFVEAAERARARIGFVGKEPRGVFLCHAFCELGATKAEAGLRAIRDFLVANPHEVLVLSLEDSVSAADTADAFDKSGLLEYVYKGSVDPLPTPRQMIERGGRVLVMGETTDGSVPWYHPQFEQLVQDTPYSFPTLAALDAAAACDADRGAATNPLFLINHWVDTTPAPRPTNARLANRRATLLARVRRCAEERGRLPGLLAVDFVDEGDLFGAVDELNGVTAPPR